jgi:hypothetical protein
MVETTSQSMHPQVVVAYLIDQRFEMLEEKLSASTVYTQPTMVDALSHKTTKAEVRVMGSTAASDYDPETIAAFLRPSQHCWDQTSH